MLPGHVKIFSMPDIGEVNEMLHRMSPKDQITDYRELSSTYFFFKGAGGVFMEIFSKSTF